MRPAKTRVYRFECKQKSILILITELILLIRYTGVWKHFHLLHEIIRIAFCMTCDWLLNSSDLSNQLSFTGYEVMQSAFTRDQDPEPLDVRTEEAVDATAIDSRGHVCSGVWSCLQEVDLCGS